MPYRLKKWLRIIHVHTVTHIRTSPFLCIYGTVYGTLIHWTNRATMMADTPGHVQLKSCDSCSTWWCLYVFVRPFIHYVCDKRYRKWCLPPLKHSLVWKSTNIWGKCKSKIVFLSSQETFNLTFNCETHNLSIDESVCVKKWSKMCSQRLTNISKCHVVFCHLLHCEIETSQRISKGKLSHDTWTRCGGHTLCSG